MICISPWSEFSILRAQKTQMAEKNFPSIFTKENYKWMLLGIVLIAAGMFLMSGGKSDNPAVFDKDKVYSFTRITIAPILILAGLVVEIIAIFKKPRAA